MSFNNIKTRIKAERGFTIVELLIVIVVIGILAAITIVAYNGVTARANTTAANATAATVAKKAEAYNAEVTGYPATLAALTNATNSGTSYYVPATSVSLITTALTTTNPGTKTSATLNFNICGHVGTATAAANLAALTAAGGVITGNRTDTWNFQSNVIQSVSVGVTSGTLTLPGPITAPITCFLATS